MLICQRNGGTTISSKVATGEQRAPRVHIALGLTSPRRFIPLQDWPRLILSLFALHNETRAYLLRGPCMFRILTGDLCSEYPHAFDTLLALVICMVPLLPILRHVQSLSTRACSSHLRGVCIAMSLYKCFMAHHGWVRAPQRHGIMCTSRLCWHWLVGTLILAPFYVPRVIFTRIPLSDRLISASVGTVVYYGFQCQLSTRNAFLLLCLAIGISGSIVPFTHWFNERKYKVFIYTSAQSSR